MREIKFRCYDKTRSEMFTYDNQCGVKQLNFNQDMEVGSVELFEYLPNGSFAFKTLDINNVELMQFTGLFDKQGVEVYEGDIILDSSYFKYLIIYDTNEARFGAVCEGKTYDLNKNEICKVKIIGNIYEHSYLLDNN